MPTPIRPERDRAVFELLRALRGRTASEIASRTFVAASTVQRLRRSVSEGGTRYPRHLTMAALAEVAGLEYRLVPKDQGRQEWPRRRTTAEARLNA